MLHNYQHYLEHSESTPVQLSARYYCSAHNGCNTRALRGSRPPPWWSWSGSAV